MKSARKQTKVEKQPGKEVKSPLRYPGGKSKAVNQIIPYIAQIAPHYDEFREPFVGGGSVFLAAMQRINPSALYRIGDLNYEVYHFWNELQKNGYSLIERIQRLKNSFKDGNKLFKFLIDEKIERTPLERAARFFVLNHITFSGTTDSGGYSEEAFKKRFTQSAVDRLKPLPNLIRNVDIEHGSYEKLLFTPAENSGSKVFIFLDPPYLRPAKSKLYGKNGDLHTSFDHNAFAKNMKLCRHDWLITYDDSEEVRNLFSFANIYEWQLQYGMNNVALNGKAAKGNELFITNYGIERQFQSTLDNKEMAKQKSHAMERKIRNNCNRKEALE